MLKLKNLTNFKKRFIMINRQLKELCGRVLVAMFILIGFTEIKKRGVRDPSARVLTMAPHSTFMDALPFLLTGVPTAVARGESRRTPVFGSTCQSFSYLNSGFCYCYLDAFVLLAYFANLYFYFTNSYFYQTHVKIEI